MYEIAAIFLNLLLIFVIFDTAVFEFYTVQIINL